MRKLDENNGARNEPRIAVLIPVYNEEMVIAGTIAALVADDNDPKDIYVVDDCSTDRTVEIATKLGVNVFKAPQNGGKAVAQTLALKHFDLLDKYDWITFLDGDTKVSLGFTVAMYSKANEQPDVALFVGQVRSVKNSHLYSASRAFDYTYGHDVAKTGQSNFNVIFVSPGCASMYRTKVLRELHIDHMTLAEDMDLTMQVHRLGGKVVYVPEAVVDTQDPSTLKDYHKQVLRWYRGFWQVVLKHKVFGWGPKSRVDFYMMLLTIDAIVFNRVIWLAIMAIWFPQAMPIALGIDLTTAFVIALYVSYKTGRKDVVWKFPGYYWISYLNFYAYVRSFIEIVVLRKELLAWNKVARYEFESKQAN